jgi:hypothetical protein
MVVSIQPRFWIKGIGKNGEGKVSSRQATKIHVIIVSDVSGPMPFNHVFSSVFLKELTVCQAILFGQDTHLTKDCNIARPVSRSC